MYSIDHTRIECVSNTYSTDCVKGKHFSQEGVPAHAETTQEARAYMAVPAGRGRPAGVKHMYVYV